MATDENLKEMVKDPSLSNWFRDALLSALNRDPVDAASDAGLLSLVLDKRADALLSAAMRDHRQAQKEMS